MKEFKSIKLCNPAAHGKLMKTRQWEINVKAKRAAGSPSETGSSLFGREEARLSPFRKSLKQLSLSARAASFPPRSAIKRSI